MPFLNRIEQSERLKTIRTKFNINQTALATELKYDRAYISNVENGRAPLTFLLIEKLANFYEQKTQQQLNLNWLLLGVGEMSLVEEIKPSEGGIVNIANNVQFQTQVNNNYATQLHEKDILIGQLEAQINLLKSMLLEKAK